MIFDIRSENRFLALFHFSLFAMSNRSAKAGSRGQKDSGGSKDRSRSRSPVRTNNEVETVSMADFQKMMVDTMKAQMPSMIIEASKVARASISADQDESKRAMAAEMKKLKQSHADLALMSKVSNLKSDGKSYIYLRSLS